MCDPTVHRRDTVRCLLILCPLAFAFLISMLPQTSCLQENFVSRRGVSPESWYISVGGMFPGGVVLDPLSVTHCFGNTVKVPIGQAAITGTTIDLSNLSISLCG